MFVRAVNKVLKPFGFKLIGANDYSAHAGTVVSGDSDYVLFSYTKPDGSFDYESYKKTQEEGNKRKIDNVWALEKNIKFVAEYLKDKIGKVSAGLCHGTRRGKEQEWFKKYLGAGVSVIGTEISETAKNFPDTIQWDFHEAKPEWIDSIDFIYSNSFDHSYDPEKCLNAWMSCVRPGGLCILEHTDSHGPAGASNRDPFGAHLIQMPFLIVKWGAGKYGVREILRAPAKNDNLNYAAFIVIQKY